MTSGERRLQIRYHVSRKVQIEYRNANLVRPWNGFTLDVCATSWASIGIVSVAKRVENFR